MKRQYVSLLVFALLVLAACDKSAPAGATREVSALGAASAPDALTQGQTSSPAPSSARRGDVNRGKQLVAQFECNRCHDGTGHEPVARAKHCVACHDEISRGVFPAPAAAVARWNQTVDAYTVVPTLSAIGARLEPAWLVSYLLHPTDLRPHLAPSMPRLALNPEQAEDIAAYLVRDSTVQTGNPQPPDSDDSALGRGRRVMETKACLGCHEFSGADRFAISPELAPSDERRKRAVRLSPDLRFVRDRFRQDKLVAWLLDPSAVKADTLMPSHNLTGAEARDVATYLIETPLLPQSPKPLPERLPPLERKVTFDEVNEKVFAITCRHCHSDPDVARGDGGPGNTGGFGFPARRLDLASYRGVGAGYVDSNGERQSIFAPLPDGTPRLVAALLARQAEERGAINPEVRGMPLGLPAATPEQVQLVESWIAQGRPR